MPVMGSTGTQGGALPRLSHALPRFSSGSFREFGGFGGTHGQAWDAGATVTSQWMQSEVPRQSLSEYTR